MIEEDSNEMSSRVARHERGLHTLRRIGGPQGMVSLTALNDVAPDLVRFAIEFAYGEVLARPGLDLRTRQLCTVAALSAMGHAVPQLTWHIDAALHVGATPSDVDEVQRIAASYARDSVAPGPTPPSLDDLTRELTTVALLTALGTNPSALRTHVRASLDAGASRDQVVAVIEQMAVYAGFPAALNGIAAARDIFQGR
jgi:4-carboxymuconolactone decarboxylase